MTNNFNWLDYFIITSLSKWQLTAPILHLKKITKRLFLLWHRQMCRPYDIDIINTRCCFVFYRVLSRSMPTQSWDVDDIINFVLIHWFVQYGVSVLLKLRSRVAGSVRNNLSAMPISGYTSWTPRLWMAFRRSILLLTEHLLRLLNIDILNFQPQTKFLHHSLS